MDNNEQSFINYINRGGGPKREYKNDVEQESDGSDQDEYKNPE